ncbi:hypothetical protein AVEN_138035-1 [Araneus ventricosus]|uniref:Uncharacterized protein n=1 Tax=Araneus ventricosus TaxID=182803 RepID=A0A4Y2PG83_ARAVE|nr:hypothetical protein AVEN_138035-1 [Araneus ventricosus]
MTRVQACRETTFEEVERFDDNLKKWEKIKSLNKHRSAHGACVFKDSMTVSMCSVPGYIIVRPLNMQQPSP